MTIVMMIVMMMMHADDDDEDYDVDGYDDDYYYDDDYGRMLVALSCKSGGPRHMQSNMFRPLNSSIRVKYCRA